jgi:hypothetical protein
MGYYTFVTTNHAPRGQRQIEPVLVRLTKARYNLAPLEVVRFTPRYFEPVSCTRPMVYGAGGVSPRIRMRRQDQLGVRRMPTDRYEPIG